MTLFVIIISAIIAVAAYHYNNWYIAKEKAQAVVVDTPVLAYDRKAERLQFSIDAADAEIEVAMTRREKLMALYDCKAEELEAVTPNGKEWQKIQKSLLAYENQLNTVEKRISKAQFTRKQALAELEEIA